MDDEPAQRDMLRTFFRLTEGVELVGEATSAGEAIAITRTRIPDAVVLDLDLGGHDGLDALPALREAAPSLRVVVYSGADDREGEVLAAGADAWVSKSSSLRELYAAVLDITDGGGAPTRSGPRAG